MGRLLVQGIAGVDAASRSQFGKPFVELPSGRQIEVLNAVEENSKAFFDLLVSHTRQGFYGDPRHGGNRSVAGLTQLRMPAYGRIGCSIRLPVRRETSR